MSIIQNILSASSRIKNSRNISSVFRHLVGEVNELRDEVTAKVCDLEHGEDGILGEAVDVILCALDVAYQDNPNLTEEQIAAVVSRKLEKWERLYGNA
jgi:hypothetical protein